MNANPHVRLGKPSVTLKLSAEDHIRELSGEVEALFGASAVELWRKPLRRAFQAPVAEAMARVALGIRQGGDEPQVCGDGHGGEYMLVGRPAGREEPGGVVLFVYRLSGDAEWWEHDAAAARPDGQADRDGFLDEAALTLKDGDGSVTMFSVHGGLDAEADGRMSRVVEDHARRSGARRTARLDNALYGILHGRDADAEKMLHEISGAALDAGLVKDRDVFSAEQIEADGADLAADAVRATLSHGARGLRGRIASGFRRFGLGRRYDEARSETAALANAVRQAIKAGTMAVETRPILSLKRQAVAIRQVRAHPLVDGRPVDSDVLLTLGGDNALARELELAVIGQALAQHRDWKLWRGVSLRVMASVRAETLREPDMQMAIGRLIGRAEVSPGRLILRPEAPLGGTLAGKGDVFLDSPSAHAWRISVPDFYAFLKGEVALDSAGLAPSEPSAYIEVAADRLKGLIGQKDGRFLVRTLLKTWRDQGTEIIATSVDHHDQFAMLEDLEVRYAKGARIGDWTSN
ncbi:EAL domain-containing protein [Minwuia thermotolerans]|uniref:EAL domain-containing protein n=1 Tax=Minwuia thermotolerans TaxID=2056226 RepID=UPI000F630B33|nr:EAL domain-containing protein [Minwuia thermotolerans]